MEHSQWVEILRGIANRDDLPELAVNAARLDPMAAGLVSQIVSELERGRRREKLLRAMHDTASDITALRDVQAVLKAISVRTRQLLGTDMAYVSLNDQDAQETFIQESDGVRTFEYRTIRMPLGTGILGKAATGRQLVATSDYMADLDIVHLSNIDRIVAGEGVRAIMGAPLTVHGQVLGALLVAMRTPTQFSTQEADAVSMLARQAAVALDNAKRFADIASTLDSLGSTRKLERDELAEVQSLLAVDELLLEVVVRRPHHADLLELAHRLVETELALIDADHRVVLTTVGGSNPESLPGGSSWLPAGQELRRVTSVAALSGQAFVSDGDEPVTVVPAVAAGKVMGSVVARGRLGENRRRILDRVGVFVAVLGLIAKAAERAEQRLHSEVLDDLLSGGLRDRARFYDSLARFGLHPADTLQMLLVEDTTGAVEQTLRPVMTERPGLIAWHEGHWCLVTSESGLAEVILRKLQAAGHPARVGTSGPIEDITVMPGAHRRASMALASLRGLGREGVGDGSQLRAIDAVIEAADDEHPLLASIQPLIDHDLRRSTDLTLTAWTYLEADRSFADAAKGLFVHRNTVRQRIQRIRSLLGDDWDVGARRLELHLALWIWRVRSLDGTAVDSHPSKR